MTVLIDGQPTLLADNSSIGNLSSFSSAFEQVTLDLSPYMGQVVQLQFAFESGEFGFGEGWYVDDVNVTFDAGVPTARRVEVFGGQNTTVEPFGSVRVVDLGPDQVWNENDEFRLTPDILGSGYSYQWVVIDATGTPAGGGTAADLAFTPDSAGLYTVRLTVTDLADGASYADEMTLDVRGVATNVTLTSTPAVPLEGELVRVTASLDNPEEGVGLQYAWNVTDPAGNPVNFAATTPDVIEFIPSDDGAYVVSVTVTEDDGGSHTASVQLPVGDRLPGIDPGITSHPGGGVAEGDAVTLVADVGAAPDAQAPAAALPPDNPVVDAGLTPEAPTGAPASRRSTDGGAPSAGTNAGGFVAADSLFESTTYAWSVTRNGAPVVLPADVATTNPTFSFVPADDGAYVVTLSASDDDGNVVTRDVPLPVQNVAPGVAITGAPAGGVAEGTPVSLGSTVADPGIADSHAYAWSVTRDGQSLVLPQGTVTNASAFAFTPTAPGAYVVQLVVTDDDGGATTATAAFTVGNTDPSGVTIVGPVTGQEGAELQFAGTAQDPGGAGALGYAWSVTRDGLAHGLPAGTATDGTTFRFTPDDDGLYRVTLTVIDGGGATASAVHSVSVSNLAPVAVLTGPDGADEGTAVQYAVAVTDPGAADAHAYAWRVTRNGSPFGLPPGTPTTGAAFAFTPPDEGAYVVEARVDDGDGGAVTVSRNLAVANAAPRDVVFDGPAVATEGQSFTLAGRFVDPGVGDGWTATVSWGDGWPTEPLAIASDLTFRATHVFPDGPGDRNVLVTITDSGGGSVTVTRVVSVLNAPPVVNAGADQFVQAGATVVGTVTVGDVPADQWSATVDFDGDGPAAPVAVPASATDFVNGRFDFSHVFANPGEHRVLVAVTDDDGGVGTDELVVRVNGGPTIVSPIADATFPEDAPKQIGVADLRAVFAHPFFPDEALTFSVSANSAPNLVTATLNPEGGVDLQPLPDASGVADITVRATDPDGLWAEETFRVTLTPQNDAPVGVDDAVVTAEDTPRVFASAQLLGNDLDVDGDVLTVAGVNATAETHGSVSLNPTTGDVVYTPAPDFNGTSSFTYTVSDGKGGTAVVTVRVNVTAVNDAPVASPDAATTAEDVPLVLSAALLTGNDATGPADEQGQVLTLAAVRATAGTMGSVVLNADGTVTFTPQANYYGPASFEYVVQDDGSTNGIGDPKQSVGVVNVLVSPVNDAPTLAPPANQGASAGTTRSMTLTGITPGPANEGQQVLALSAVSSNPSLVSVMSLVNHGNGMATLTYTTAAGAPLGAAATITVTAADDGGTAGGGADRVTRAFDVTIVTPVAPPAWLAPGSAATWDAGTRTLTVTGAATLIADPAADAPVIVANGAGAVVTFSPGAGSPVTLGGLWLSNGARATLNSAGATRTLIVPGVNFMLDATAQLDLGDNALVLRSGGSGTDAQSVVRRIAGYLKTGLENGGNYDWLGAGVSSAQVAADNATAGSVLYGLGLLQNNVAAANTSDGTTTDQSTGNEIYTTFAGQAVSLNDVLVCYSYMGDADLDGAITGTDYSLIDSGFATNLSGWLNGDFDYSGQIDGTDYALIDNAFAFSSGAPSRVAPPADQGHREDERPVGSVRSPNSAGLNVDVKSDEDRERVVTAIVP